jgi:hypothetical protein
VNEQVVKTVRRHATAQTAKITLLSMSMIRNGKASAQAPAAGFEV